MILLDTDHLTVLKYPENSQCARLTARIAASEDPDFATTIVNAEEQLRGWLAEINRQFTPQQQVFSYEHLRGCWTFFAGFLCSRSMAALPMSSSAYGKQKYASEPWI